ncbi:MAG: hypothetical protein K2N01_12460 [Lachnospiraceae bacterium]|nr:hypothetical protein [Lachnospiraceae bacterium]
MRERLQRFMMGRYGADQLSKLYLGVAVVCMVVSLFTRWNVFYLMGLLLLIYVYYRMFSRNIPKMYAQNQKFLNLRYRAVAKWNNKKKERAQRQIYRFYTCPGCKQRVRVPRGKGRIQITCPKCRMEFVKKS